MEYGVTSFNFEEYFIEDARREDSKISLSFWRERLVRDPSYEPV